MLDMFFAGDTTCAQEKALEEYFCSGAPVPPEYECYREMFGWYASGMDEDALPPEVIQPVPDEPFAPITPVIMQSKCYNHKMMWWSSVAAVVTVAVLAGLGFSIASLPDRDPYGDCFVMRDGKVIAGEEIKSDIDATIMAACCLEQEINFNMEMIDQPDID